MLDLSMYFFVFSSMLDVGTLAIKLDFEKLAVGPARHDHVFLGHGVVAIFGEDRTREVLDQAFELRNVLQAGADLVWREAVPLHGGLEQIHRVIGADCEHGGTHGFVVAACCRRR